MKIGQNKVVAVDYALTVEGKQIDASREGAPLEYIHGTHMMIAGFEKGLEGAEEGAAVEFDVAPEEGYGTYNPQHRFDIPKSSFEVNGVLREDLLVPGTVVPMHNSSGHIIQGTVAEVGADKVTMDFNHPLAGKTLHFAVKVVSVREATEKELTEGLHGEYLPLDEDECGCGCGHHHHDCDCHEHHDGDCCHGHGHCKHEDK